MTRRIALAVALVLAAIVSPTLSATPAHAMPYGGQAEFIGTGTAICGSSCSISATSTLCTFTGFNTTGPTLADAGVCTATLHAGTSTCFTGTGTLVLSTPTITIVIPITFGGTTFMGTGGVPVGAALAEGFLVVPCIPPSTTVVFGGTVQWVGN